MKGSNPKQKNYSLQNNVGQVQNMLSVPNQQRFTNPYMEDGGVAEGCDCGTKKAEDGSLMFTSDGQGDIVEGDSFERDRVDAKLNSGEMVLNAAQQQRLMDMLRGKISVDEMGDGEIVEGVPADYQEDLYEDGKTEDNKIEGLKKLLEALGK